MFPVYVICNRKSVCNTYFKFIKDQETKEPTSAGLSKVEANLAAVLLSSDNVMHPAFQLKVKESRIIGAVRGAHSQLWGTIIPVCSLYAARKYDRRFGTSAIV